MDDKAQDPLTYLREDFRLQLTTFYSRVKLAPPYDSVENAIRHLTIMVRRRPVEEQRRLTGDAAARWQAYRAAFVESGLHLKHRGILGGLAQRAEVMDLPDDHRTLLDLFRSNPSPPPSTPDRQ